MNRSWEQANRGGSPGFVHVAKNDASEAVLVYFELSGYRLYHALGNLYTTLGLDWSSRISIMGTFGILRPALRLCSARTQRPFSHSPTSLSDSTYLLSPRQNSMSSEEKHRAIAIRYSR